MFAAFVPIYFVGFGPHLLCAIYLIVVLVLFFIFGEYLGKSVRSEMGRRPNLGPLNDMLRDRGTMSGPLAPFQTLNPETPKKQVRFVRLSERFWDMGLIYRAVKPYIPILDTSIRDPTLFEY